MQKIIVMEKVHSCTNVQCNFQTQFKREWLVFFQIEIQTACPIQTQYIEKQSHWKNLLKYLLPGMYSVTIQGKCGGGGVLTQPMYDTIFGCGGNRLQ
jgi:hypothetical protein